MEDKHYIVSAKSHDMIDEYEEIKRGINGLVRAVSEKKELTKRKGARRL